MTKLQREAIQAIMRSLFPEEAEAERKAWKKLRKQMREDRSDD